MMNEKKYAVLLTDGQEVKILECDPQEELFSIARGAIDCDWIEIVEPELLTKDGYLMLIDEEGKLRDQDLLINCVASDLYGADQHGDPIIGNAVIVKAADDSLELMTHGDAQGLADKLEQRLEQSVEKISRAFGLLPIPKPETEIGETPRRQSCKRNEMER